MTTAQRRLQVVTSENKLIAILFRRKQSHFGLNRRYLNIFLNSASMKKTIRPESCGKRMCSVLFFLFSRSTYSTYIRMHWGGGLYLQAAWRGFHPSVNYDLMRKEKLIIRPAWELKKQTHPAVAIVLSTQLVDDGRRTTFPSNKSLYNSCTSRRSEEIISNANSIAYISCCGSCFRALLNEHEFSLRISVCSSSFSENFRIFFQQH